MPCDSIFPDAIQKITITHHIRNIQRHLGIIHSMRQSQIVGHLVHHHKGILSKRRIITLSNKSDPSGLLSKTIWSLPPIDLACEKHICNSPRLPKNTLFHRRLHDHVDINLTIPKFAPRPFDWLKNLKIKIPSAKWQINQLLRQVGLGRTIARIVSQYNRTK